MGVGRGWWRWGGKSLHFRSGVPKVVDIDPPGVDGVVWGGVDACLGADRGSFQC